MKNHFLKWAAVVSAVALLSGVLALSANAHIGSSHSQVSTDGPDLVSATADSDDTVIYCFDEEVTTIDDLASDFILFGYDSEYSVANDAGDADEGTGTDENCVEVTFDVASSATAGEEEFDVRDLTVAHVDDSSVEDADGDENIEGTVALNGSTADGGEGRTAAPNLVAVDAGSDSVTYTFDQNVNCEDIDDSDDARDAAHFGFYDEDGQVSQGDSIRECNDNEVEVVFDDATTSPNEDDPGDAVRFFVSEYNNTLTDFNEIDEAFVTPEGTGVCTPQDDSGTELCLTTEHFGGQVQHHPDLTDASRVDENQWLYTFDSDVDDIAITPTRFLITEEDGTGIFSSTAAGDNCSEDDGNSVECSFAEAGVEDSADFEFPQANVNHCAVENDDATTGNAAGSEACATFGHSNVFRSGIAPGATDAPDLESVTFDILAEQARFCFDENVTDDATDYNGALFYLFDQDGDKTSAGGDTDVDDVEDNCVTVDFDENDLTAAVGGGVDSGAVEDFLENASVPATVGPIVTNSGGTTTVTGSGGTTTTTTTTTSTTTTTTTTGTGTGTTGGPVNRKVATSLSIRYDRTVNAFKGSAAARSKRCQRGRRVTLKKVVPGPNRTVGKDTTNRSGNWKIRKRVRRGRFYAVVAKKSYTNRTGGTTTCLRDKSPTIAIRRRG